MNDPQEGQQYTFEVLDAGVGLGVDEVNCIIRNVSMITGNLVAKGHDLEVDNTTLKQIYDCAKASGQVPVKLNHGSGIEAVNGYLNNFRRDGDKVRADWNLLKTHDKTPTLLELATRQPKTVGLSVTFRGAPEVKGTKKHARCTELVSTDLVPHPAANPDGMFSEGVDSRGRGSMPDNAPPAAAAAKPGAPADPLQVILAKLEGIEERMTNIENFCQEVDEHLSEVSGAPAPGGDDDGEPEEFGVGAGDIITQLEAYFSGKVTEMEEAQQAQQVQQAFSVLREKQAQLVTSLEEKQAEITALNELVQEYRAAAPMKPVNAGGGDTTMFSTAVTPAENLTEFQTMVRKEVTELSAKHPDLAEAALRVKAIRSVMGTHPGVYEKHLKQVGASRV
jgi:hypothetical protein